MKLPEAARPGADVESAPSTDERGAVRRWVGRVGVGVLLLAIAVLVYQAAVWPDVERLADENPTTTRFLERERQLARERGTPEPSLRWVPYERISPYLKHAVVVEEDIGFFSHDGFAWDEMEIAVRESVEQGKRLRGASTITQQVAKNLWLTPRRSLWRKVREAILTWQLERHLSKQRILEIYLNTVAFGPGVYGAENAARRYFGLSAGSLGPAQSAQLAAALPRPGEWHPGSGAPGYRRHVERVRRRMARSDWLRRLL